MVSISWAWVWLSLAAIISLLSPAAFWRGRRLAYAAALCAALSAALGADCVWGAQRVGHLDLRFVKSNSLSAAVYSSHLSVGKGRLFIAMGLLRLADPSLAKHETPVGLSARAGVDTATTFSNGWHGFDLTLTNPTGPGYTDSGGYIMFPVWFAACALLPIPILSILTRRARSLKRMRLDGRCLNCDYDLRGHNPGDKCPECGTPKPAASPSPKLPTTAQTQEPAPKTT